MDLSYLQRDAGQRHAAVSATRGHSLSASPPDRGFTLLEVMIAVAVLAITLTVLFGNQSQSLSLATEAKFNTQAAFLLEMKLAELEGGLLETFDAEGDFGELHPQFRWRMEVDEADFVDFDLVDTLAAPIQQVTLTVSWVDSPYTQSITYYQRERRQL